MNKFCSTFMFVLLNVILLYAQSVTRLQITCKPGYRVYIDDVLAGVSSENFDGLYIANIQVGLHRIRIEKIGFVKHEETIQLYDGKINEYVVGEIKRESMTRYAPTTNLSDCIPDSLNIKLTLYDEVIEFEDEETFYLNSTSGFYDPKRKANISVMVKGSYLASIGYAAVPTTALGKLTGKGTRQGLMLENFNIDVTFCFPDTTITRNYSQELAFVTVNGHSVKGYHLGQINNRDPFSQEKEQKFGDDEGCYATSLHIDASIIGITTKWFAREICKGNVTFYLQF